MIVIVGVVDHHVVLCCIVVAAGHLYRIFQVLTFCILLASFSFDFEIFQFLLMHFSTS